MKRNCASKILACKDQQKCIQYNIRCSNCTRNMKYKDMFDDGEPKFTIDLEELARAWKRGTKNWGK